MVRRTMVKNVHRFHTNFLIHIFVPLAQEHMATSCSNYRANISLFTVASAKMENKLSYQDPKDTEKRVREDAKSCKRKSLGGNGLSTSSLILWKKVHNPQR